MKKVTGASGRCGSRALMAIQPGTWRSARAQSASSPAAARPVSAAGGRWRRWPSRAACAPAAGAGGGGGGSLPVRRVEEVVGPLVGHDRAGERQDQEHGRAPDADHVVPVEVARAAAAGRGPEQRDRPHRLARPPARPPEVDAEHDEPEEAQVGRARDRPEVVARAEPAMPLDHLVERVVHRREAAQHHAAVLVHEERAALAAEAHHRGGAAGRRAA